jgi:hypothetical protein
MDVSSRRAVVSAMVSYLFQDRPSGRLMIAKNHSKVSTSNRALSVRNKPLTLTFDSCSKSRRTLGETF